MTEETSSNLRPVLGISHPWLLLGLVLLMVVAIAIYAILASRSQQPHQGFQSPSPTSTSAANQIEPTAGLGVQADLISKAQTIGTVRVIVGLNVPVTEDEPEFPSAIAKAQAELLDNLSPYKATTIAAYTVIPYIALEVDEAALQYLIASPLVTSIEEDITLPP